MENNNSIYRDERRHLDSDKEDAKYYIGFCKYYPIDNYIIMTCSVSPRSFLKYSGKRIRTYLRNYSAIIVRSPRINIMKLSISPHDGSYNVIIKTHWLRLVQRHWRKVYQERCNAIQEASSPRSLANFAMRGRSRLAGTPGLLGMMRAYNRPICQMSSNTKTD